MCDWCDCKGPLTIVVLADSKTGEMADAKVCSKGLEAILASTDSGMGDIWLFSTDKRFKYDMCEVWS